MIHPLKNAVGTWNNQQQSAIFRWEADANNDRYVHLIGLAEYDGTLKPDGKSRNDKDLRTATGADMLSISVRVTVGAYGVNKKSFLLFTSENYLCDEQEINAALQSPDLRASLIQTITIGHADLQYWVKKVKNGNTRVISFALQSSADIADGIVGYSYDFGEKQICLPFPGLIKGGGKKNKYGTMLIPESSQIHVVVTDKRFSGNVKINEGSFIGGLF